MTAIKIYLDEDVHTFIAHTGIIVATQDSPRRNLRALFNLLNALSAETIRDQLVFLNNWA